MYVCMWLCLPFFCVICQANHYSSGWRKHIFERKIVALRLFKRARAACVQRVFYLGSCKNETGKKLSDPVKETQECFESVLQAVEVLLNAIDALTSKYYLHDSWDSRCFAIACIFFYKVFTKLRSLHFQLNGTAQKFIQRVRDATKMFVRFHFSISKFARLL